jgi:3-oxoacyl-[acyl-carrier protein] reductase
LDLGLTGKRVAVAASTSGLGFAAAQALAREGARVVLCGRDAARLSSAAARIDGDVTTVRADISTPGGADGFVDQATGLLGGLDVLVVNTPGAPAGTVATVDLEQYAPALEQVLLSAVAMCRRAVPAMRAAGWGRIVAITSIAVREPIPDLLLSNIARTGLTGFLKTLAREVAGDGVTVNSVQPGYHRTERLEAWAGERLPGLAADVPAGRVGEPADLGALVAFLCSDAARYITGVAVPVDGGLHSGLQ